MEEFVISSQQTKAHQKIVRVSLIVIGMVLYVFPGFFLEGYSKLLFRIFGLFLFIPGVTNPFSIFGGSDKMILSDDFVKVTDEMTLTRTAYWTKISKAVLTRFSLRIYYDSGAGENFRIPYLKQEEFEKLRSRILQKSKEHNFAIEETQWWKIFN